MAWIAARKVGGKEPHKANHHWKSSTLINIIKHESIQVHASQCLWNAQFLAYPAEIDQIMTKQKRGVRPKTQICATSGPTYSEFKDLNITCWDQGMSLIQSKKPPWAFNRRNIASTLVAMASIPNWWNNHFATKRPPTNTSRGVFDHGRHGKTMFL